MMHATDEIARLMAMDAAAHGGSADLSNYYTKSETDAHIADKVSEIVADAPGDFDTLKEMSDWIASHEDSAAAMNSAIMQNAADIDAVEAQQTEQAAAISTVTEESALNCSTLGYQRKNLLKNTAVSQTKNGVTFTVNSDGSVTANGTAIATTTLYINIFSTQADLSEDKLYLFSGCSGGSNETFFLRYYNQEASKKYNDVYDGDLPVTYADGPCNFAIIVKDGTTVNNQAFYPMLRYAEITDDTYEPYKPSVQEQITSLETIVDSAFVSGENISGNGGDDLNTVTKSGQYKYSGSPANRPGTQTYGVLIVYNPMNKPYQGSSTYVVQVAIAGVNAAHFGVASSAGVYVRTSANGGTEWSEWLKLVFENTTSAANMFNAENLEQTD